MKAQNELILKHLKRRPITTMQAIDKYSVTRLSARIYDLKQMGHDIIDTWIDTKNKRGKKCRVKRYRLVA